MSVSKDWQWKLDELDDRSLFRSETAKVSELLLLLTSKEPPTGKKHLLTGQTSVARKCILGNRRIHDLLESFIVLLRITGSALALALLYEP
jgi:hypothetical protein